MLNCPFCSTSLVEAKKMTTGDPGVHQVVCLQCGARGPETFGADTAAERWNDRPMKYAGQFNGNVKDNYLKAYPRPWEIDDMTRSWPPKGQLRRLVDRWGLKCIWCGQICNPRLAPNADAFPTREHMIRRADGGSSRMENLKIACRKCNNTRHKSG